MKYNPCAKIKNKILNDGDSFLAQPHQAAIINWEGERKYCPTNFQKHAEEFIHILNEVLNER